MLELPSILQAVVRWLRGADAGCFEVVRARKSRCLSFLTLFATSLPNCCPFDLIVSFVSPVPPHPSLRSPITSATTINTPDLVTSYSPTIMRTRRKSVREQVPRDRTARPLTC